jgi:hypothetical protein
MFTPKYEDLYKLLEYTETIHAVYLFVNTYLNCYVVPSPSDQDHDFPSYLSSRLSTAVSGSKGCTKRLVDKHGLAAKSYN